MATDDDPLDSYRRAGLSETEIAALAAVAAEVNPPSVWIWSAEPTHEPLVAVALFDAASPVAEARERSRGGSRANTHPQTKRTRCARTWCVTCAAGECPGRPRRALRTSTTTAGPALNHTGRADRFPGHPATVYVRDDLLVGAVHRFFATRVLGPERQDRLRADLQDQATTRPATRQADQRKALDRSLADLDRREGRLIIRTLETQDDPDGVLADRVRIRLAELLQERHHR
jgi:site-specific DNA recombinase